MLYYTIMLLICSVAPLYAASSSGPSLSPEELMPKKARYSERILRDNLTSATTDDKSAVRIAKILFEYGYHPEAADYMRIAQVRSIDPLVQQECERYITCCTACMESYTSYAFDSPFDETLQNLLRLSTTSITTDAQRATYQSIAHLYMKQAIDPATTLTETRTLEQTARAFQAMANKIDHPYAGTTHYEPITLPADLMQQLRHKAQTTLATYTADETPDQPKPLLQEPLIIEPPIELPASLPSTTQVITSHAEPSDTALSANDTYDTTSVAIYRQPLHDIVNPILEQEILAKIMFAVSTASDDPEAAYARLLLQIYLDPDYRRALTTMVDYVEELDKLDIDTISPDLRKLIALTCERCADIAFHIDNPERWHANLHIAQELTHRALFFTASLTNIPDSLVALTHALANLPSAQETSLHWLIHNTPELLEALQQLTPAAQSATAAKLAHYTQQLPLNNINRAWLSAHFFGTPWPSMSLEQGRGISCALEKSGYMPLKYTFDSESWHMLHPGPDRTEPARYLLDKAIETNDPATILKTCKRIVDAGIAELYDDVCCCILNTSYGTKQAITDLLIPMIKDGHEPAQWCFITLSQSDRVEENLELEEQIFTNLATAKHDYLRIEALIQKACYSSDDTIAIAKLSELIKKEPRYQSKIRNNMIPILLRLAEKQENPESTISYKEQQKHELKELAKDKDPFVTIQWEMYGLHMNQLLIKDSQANNKKKMYQRSLEKLETLRKKLYALRPQGKKGSFEHAFLTYKFNQLAASLQIIGVFICSNSGNIGQTHNYIVDAFKINPYTPGTKLVIENIVCTLIEKGKHAAANQLLQTLQEAHSHINYITDLHITAATTQRDIATLEAIGNKYPVDSYNADALAFAAQLMQDDNEKEKYLLQALKLVPQHRDANYLLGELYQKSKRYHESLAIWESMAHDHHEAAFIAGFMHINGLVGFSPERAEKLFESAIRLSQDPSNTQKYRACHLCAMAHKMAKDITVSDDALDQIHLLLLACQEKSKTLSPEVQHQMAFAIRAVENRRCELNKDLSIYTPETEKIFNQLQQTNHPHALDLMAERLFVTIMQEIGQFKPYHELSQINQMRVCQLFALCNKSSATEQDIFSKRLQALKLHLKESVFIDMDQETITALPVCLPAPESSCTSSSTDISSSVAQFQADAATIERLKNGLKAHSLDAAAEIAEHKIDELYHELISCEHHLSLQDPRRYQEILKQLANDNCHAAQLFLGMHIGNGAGPKDPLKDAELIQAATQSPLAWIRNFAELNWAYNDDYTAHYKNLLALMTKYKDDPAFLTRIHLRCAAVTLKQITGGPGTKELLQKAIHHLRVISEAKSLDTLQKAEMHILDSQLQLMNLKHTKNKGEKALLAKHLHDSLSSIAQEVTHACTETLPDCLEQFWHQELARGLLAKIKLSLATLALILGNQVEYKMHLIEAFVASPEEGETENTINNFCEQLMQKGDYEHAQDTLDVLEKINPNVPYIWKLRAQLAQCTGTAADELHYLQKAGELGDHPSAFRAYEKSTAPKERDVCLKLALKFSPSDPTYIHAYAEEAWKKGHYKAAEQLLVEAAGHGNWRSKLRLAQLLHSGNLPGKPQLLRALDYLAQARAILCDQDQQAYTKITNGMPSIIRKNIAFMYLNDEHRQLVAVSGLFYMLQAKLTGDIPGRDCLIASFRVAEDELKPLINKSKWQGQQETYMTLALLHHLQAHYGQDPKQNSLKRMSSAIFAGKAAALYPLMPAYLWVIFKIAQEQTPPAPFAALTSGGKQQWNMINEQKEKQETLPCYNPENYYTKEIDQAWPDIRRQIWGTEDSSHLLR